jgi:hypothetical protein
MGLQSLGQRRAPLWLPSGRSVTSTACTPSKPMVRPTSAAAAMVHKVIALLRNTSSPRSRPRCFFGQLVAERVVSKSCSFKLCGCTIIVTHSPSKLPPSVFFVRIIGAPKRAARNVQTDRGCSGGWFVKQKRVSAATPCFRLGQRSSSPLPNNLAVKQVLDWRNVYRSYT